jgi:hypothetical protein
VQGFTASAGNTFLRKEPALPKTSRKPQHTAKIFVPEAKDGKLSVRHEQYAEEQNINYLVILSK